MRREMEKLLKRYQSLLSKIERHKRVEPANGMLEVTESHGKFFYYYREKKENGLGKRQRIENPHKPWVRAMAQNQYERRLKKLLIKRIGQMERFLKAYQEDEVERVYEDMAAGRKCLVTPLETPRSLWQKTSYPNNHYHDENKRFKTKKGDCVRSKSEKMMADLFFDHQIPYHYEKPLRIGGRTVYPDFTFYSPSRQEEIYWEHDGKMDDPVYGMAALEKIQWYEDQGLQLGDRLIVTFETRDHPLNLSRVHHFIHRHLLSI